MVWATDKAQTTHEKRTSTSIHDGDQVLQTCILDARRDTTDPEDTDLPGEAAMALKDLSLKALRVLTRTRWITFDSPKE